MKTVFSVLTLSSLIIFSFFGCDNGTKKLPSNGAELQKPDWTAYQKILDIGLVKNSYKGPYGSFSHNAFDYNKLIEHENFKELIDSQIKSLQKTKSPDEAAAKLAFWINAYNFFTIVDVCANFPLTSMKDIGWKNVRHQVGNTQYSLDHIEHKLLRPLKEPKIHFAINCASVSCPSLHEKFFREENIIEELTRLTTEAFKNPLHIELKGNKVNVSKLMDWFEVDFKQAPYFSTTGFVQQMAPPELQKEVDGHLQYDWMLNDPENVQEAMEKYELQKLN